MKDKALNYEPVEALFMSTNLFSAGLLFTYDIGGNLVTVGPHIWRPVEKGEFSGSIIPYPQDLSFQSDGRYQ